MSFNKKIMMNRRKFLANIGATTGAATVTHLQFGVSPLIDTAWASGSQLSERVCIVFDGDGGTDTINTFAPLAACQPGGNIANKRPNTALFPDPNDFFDLGEGMIAHNTLFPTSAQNYYTAGNIRLMHGTGVENHSGGHARGSEQMGAGILSGNEMGNGYLVGAMAYVDANSSATLPSYNAVDFQNGAHELFGSSSYATAANNLNDFGIEDLNDEQQAQFTKIMSAFTGGGEVIGATQNSVDAIAALAQQIASIVTITPQVPMPNTGPGNLMNTVFQLVKGLPRAVNYINVGRGGDDSHGNQENSRHQEWINRWQAIITLFEALALEPAVNPANSSRADEVVLLVKSEFARTNRNNGNDGTDHGAAMTTCLVGPSVNGGNNGVPNSAYENQSRMERQIDLPDIIAPILAWTSQCPGIESVVGKAPGSGLDLFS